ncbi:MAG: hypothetical protein A2219_08610 [Elusimicrobia bacterium RIFOXYA2_FULL_50_26]|nr:MAG: hypothetical protein A2219_08610 [Elusimicrobia bacterium RIFOXYA2_FULL_50_26]
MRGGINPLERKNRGLKSLYFKFIVGKSGKNMQILRKTDEKMDFWPEFLEKDHEEGVSVFGRKKTGYRIKAF